VPVTKMPEDIETEGLPLSNFHFIDKECAKVRN
jgi:hypothetical protein